MSGIIMKIHVLAWTPAASLNERSNEIEVGEAFENVPDVVGDGAIALGDFLLTAGRAEATVHGGATGGAPCGGRLCHAA